MTFIANNVRNLVQSDIRAMTRECVRVGGINLGQGVCRLPVEPSVIEAAVDALRQDCNSYTLAEGIPELRTGIAEKLRRHNAIHADPSSEIVVTVGTTAAYTSALNALLNRGDSIVFFEPFYGYHVGVASILGFQPQFVELTPPDFRVTADALRVVVNSSTRAIVVCTPSNPSGRMLSLGELEAIAEVAEENDLLIITDEIYEFIRFDGREHISPGSLPTLWPRTVSIMGFAKTYSVTGWRLGYAVAPRELAAPLALTHDLCYICAPSPLQYAAVAALRLPGSYYTRLVKEYQRRRDLLCAALEAAGLAPIRPEGSYFVMADIARLTFRNARDAAMALLKSTGVASVPGTAFFRGDVGNRFLRFCFAVEDELLSEACRRLIGNPLSVESAR